MDEKKFDVTPVKNAEKELKPKDSTRKIIGIIAAVAFVVSAFILVMELPEYISRKNFEKAVMYEQNYDYEKAIEFYGKVKPKDEANYSAAASKIGDLTASLEINKTVASAINAAIETNLAEISGINELENVLVSDDGKSVCFTFSGVGYYVSPEEPKENHYYTTQKDASSGLFVTKYAPSATYTGWLSTITDELKKETSNYMFKLKSSEGFSNNGVVLKLVERYVNFPQKADSDNK